MQVAGQRGRRQVKKVFQTRACCIPGIEGLAVFDIANMLRHKTGRFAVRILARECDRCLLLRAAGEHAGRDGIECRQRQRLRRISASAAHGHNGSIDHAHHGVVIAREDRAVIAEQRIGNAGGNEALPGKNVIGLDGLFAQVSAGHDQHMHAVRRGGCKQQMLKRGIGEHDAELGQIMRDGRCERESVGGIALASSTPAQQHDGTDAAGQQVALGIIDMAQALGAAKVAHHNGKWFIAAALATAQLDYCLLIGGVAGQMESAQALDGDNTAACQQLDTALNNGVAGFARAADSRRRPRAFELHTVRCLVPRNMRPAVKTGIRLRVKAPVKWVAILRGALGAHGKAVHRGSRSVIRQ